MPPAKAGDAWPNPVEGSHAQRPVRKDVERRRAPGVCPSRSTEECKGAEHRGAGNEVHDQEAEAPVRGHIARHAGRLLPSGHESDGQRQGQISTDDDGNDDPLFHQSLLPSSTLNRFSTWSSRAKTITLPEIQAAIHAIENGRPRIRGSALAKGTSARPGNEEEHEQMVGTCKEARSAQIHGFSLDPWIRLFTSSGTRVPYSVTPERRLK